MTDRRLALVVAVDRYDHPDLHQLAAPAADAEALAGVLGDPELGDFEVDTLPNPTSWAAAERVEALLAERRPRDLVLLHFSGHGLKDDSGELYLATTNTRPDRLGSTALDAAWVNRMMRRSRAQRVVLLLDCCYGGAFERGVIARSAGAVDVGDRFRPSQLVEGRGRVVITASTAMEYAFEGPRLTADAPARPSIFTGALVEGIRTGDADRDQDGHVALGELYDYVFDRVRERSAKQTPCKWEFGLRGDIILARNPRREPRPLPPPPPEEATPRPAHLRSLVAAVALMLLGALVLIPFAKDDRDYRALLDLLPAAISETCHPSEPNAGSSAQAYCDPGVYQRWKGVYLFEDRLRPPSSVAGDCSRPPTGPTYATLPAAVIRCEVVDASDPAKRYYNIEWGRADHLLTGMFQTPDGAEAGYRATYDRALAVLRDIS